MAREVYGRLSLLRPVSLPNNMTSREVVILRPTARNMTDVFATNRPSEQLTRFVAGCCRAEVGANGSSTLAEFQTLDLDAADAAELSSVVGAMAEEANASMFEPLTDGVTDPIVYDLRYPIKLQALGKPEEEWETVKQIEFVAHKIGDLSEFLDASGGIAEFYAFMRLFGTLLGTKMPMNDSVVGAMDFLDYMIIRQKILGKLVKSRGRWKRVFTSSP